MTGLRDVSKARVGDTITLASAAWHSPAAAWVAEDSQANGVRDHFSDLSQSYPKLRDAVEKLKLNDAALSFEPENIPSIGFGFRTGFLGLLHMDIVQERLSREYDLDLVLTAPSVAYVITFTGGEQRTIHTRLPPLRRCGSAPRR